MSVLTHARNQATGPLHDAVSTYDLTSEQRRRLDDILWHLGIEDGHVTNGGGIPDLGLRRAYSAAAAADIGLRLAPGAEIAQCHTCRTIASADHMSECDDAAWRCTTPRRGPSCAARYLDEH